MRLPPFPLKQEFQMSYPIAVEKLTPSSINNQYDRINTSVRQLRDVASRLKQIGDEIFGTQATIDRIHDHPPENNFLVAVIGDLEVECNNLEIQIGRFFER